MDFEHWREVARDLLARNVPPENAHWDDAQQHSLFGDTSERGEAPSNAHRVPARLIDLFRDASCHRSRNGPALMYRVLWRAAKGERDILADVTDDDVRVLLDMQREVRHDSHKMTAFVRFRELRSDDGDPRWVAWYEPAHRILARVAPFFVKRFGTMIWTIATPDGIATWDRHALQLRPADPEATAPAEDAGEALWLAYYRAIFNPARLNVRLMQQHMPQRYWANLPEARLIPELVAEAPQRAATMAEQAPTAANVRWSPPHREMRAVAATGAMPTAADIDACRRCSLWERATQGVCGRGSSSARVMLVGEQPGDEEDLQGKPFVGPAGKLLRRALRDALVLADDVYITNAVKHFSWEPRGKRRIHKTPAQREIDACRQWLDREIAQIKPRVIVALGGSALQSLLGVKLKIGDARGRNDLRIGDARVVATYHPAAVLRAADVATEDALYRTLVDDLRRAVRSASDDVTAERIDLSSG